MTNNEAGARRGPERTHTMTTAGSRVTRLALAAALAAALSSCGTPEPPPKQAKVVKRDWVGEIRAQASKLETSVEVAPLADPAVEDLKARARQREEAKDYTEASKLVQQAIGVRAEDPALWQWSAELALERAAWTDAEQRATHAFELGPKVGALCARAWLTIAASRTERKDSASAAAAEAEVAKCQVAAPIRM